MYLQKLGQLTNLQIFYTMEGKLQMSYIKRVGKGHMKTVSDCLKLYAESKGDKESVVFVSEDFSREVVTWRELYEKSCVTAKSLIRLGVRKDEVVGINLKSCPQWMYLTFGAMMAGARPVGLVFTYTDGSDLIAMMEKLQTCSLLAMDPGTDNSDWNIVKDLVELQSDGQVTSSKMPYLRYLIAHEQGENNTMQGVLHFDDLVKNIPDDIELPSIYEEDIAFLFQTSGSTGVPKLVAHTHKSLLSFREAMGVSDFSSFSDRPFAWLGGFPLNVLYGSKRVTLSGSCTMRNDRLKFLIEVVKREECMEASFLPPILHEFILHQSELTFDWSISVLSTGGQPLNKTFAKCIGKVTPLLAYGYGSTEILFGSMAFFTNQDQFKDNFCGTAFDLGGLELKIVDEQENIVPVNTKGEIYIKSPAVFKEYYNDPLKTAAVKTPDGWYKTDDIGWLDEQSMLYVEGRKSNVIISGGMNVAPEIVELVLETHPSVGSAIIVPVPDEVYHQVLCACVRINPGSVVTEEELRSFLNEYVNDKPGLFTVFPKYYMFMDEFPELYCGKIGRKTIGKMALEKFTVLDK